MIEPCRHLPAGLALAASLVTFGCSRPSDTVSVESSRATDESTGQTLAPRMSVKDHRGRVLDVPTPGQVTVLSFASRKTADQASERCRAVRVAHPGVTILEVMDLSSAPGFLASKVESKLAERHRGIVADTTKAFVETGRPVPADLEDRIHIVPDWSAAAFEAYGATNADEQVQVAIIAPHGGLSAFFAETPTTDELIAAVAAASSRR